MPETESYLVPVIDPDTGHGWDVYVEAETAKKAMVKASESTEREVHVSSTFVKEHLEVDHP